MRKLIVSIHSTANNIVTGPPDGDETDFGQWAQPGIEDSLAPFLASLDGIDTILLGRGTYEDLVRKWPAVDEWPDVSDIARRIGHKVNTVTKFVVTDTIPEHRLGWGRYEPPRRIDGAGAETRIRDLKAADGGDIVTFGSPILVQSLINAGLVDEFRIIVHPVIVSEGRRLFDNLDHRTDLRLIGVESLAGGAMIVTYATNGS